MNRYYDVVIVGYGPVGQLLAGLLGAEGFRVGVFERWDDIYPLPRACVVDDEVMRILQADRVADAFERVAVNTQAEYVWSNAQGQVLLSFKRPAYGLSGWNARYMMYQPDLERLLDGEARIFDTVEIHRGWTAIDLRMDADGAAVELESGAIEDGQWRSLQERRGVRARFVVGADGANSFVRQAMGLGWLDLGFRADWVVIDFRPNNPDMKIDMPMCGQICDPARPTSLFRRLGRYHVRWEMMLLPGETADEITRPERIWQLLSRWVKPEDGEITRRAVYTFRSAVAESWRRGAVVLAGDAAHVMPPFLGQGMCSGMRDAMALAWRLSAILRGKVQDSVLDSYGVERKAHVQGVIARSVALGKVVCITDPELAARRDAQFFAGQMPALPDFPKLTTGLLHRVAGQVQPPAGELCLQAQVRMAGRTGRFDDLVGRGWMVLSIVTGLDQALSPQHRDFLNRLGARCIHIGGRAEPAIIDVDGRYDDFFKSMSAQVLVVRPDFYLFGGVASLSQLPAMITDLMEQLPPAACVASLINPETSPS